MKEIPQSRLRKIRTLTLSEDSGHLRLLNNDEEISLIDLASNDYLGLSQDSRLIEAAKQSMISEGIGAGGSRLVTGNRPIHNKLEKALSKWLGFEKVLLFPSGFQANIAAMNALANRKTVVIADKFIHHSLLVGIKSSGAKLKRFNHNSLTDLERLLKIHVKKESYYPPLVVTESLFSMEGTSPKLKEIAALCNQYHAMLFVDEAHALGVMGSQGRGLCYELSQTITMISGTFGKAFGSGGAFLATNNVLGEQIIQTSGAFRYTTALAPPLAAAALEALNIIKSDPHKGEKLQAKSLLWRSELSKNGWAYPKGNGPIISLVIGSDQESLNKQHQLEKNGLLTMAIRPPTVPEGTARLRLVVRDNLPNGTLKKLLLHLGKQL
ncbi:MULTISPECIES: aminotransferase class I/II-fold pyridoxal phosphate-dependent enzyme [unclassified Prochlorococcus]|uniref:aminotransferase class I/II-fold pyridoxal phosphate-dependent enzyme n=1 Tax=unclassified Prochlorococcus TaxID=2627481 RepID=UPI0005337014|nr:MULTISPECIES: 8-amino-7-oxononanoate synthase [unclassified Prochlorococcus]KGG14770.1 8-amino-7-oxononanoate synthase [Prochlorococcus sp. MIT 0602]KGG15796.1 8-amino-7-oxononanoate synthase [Prochlorococcus sp. MIT 0603]